VALRQRSAGSEIRSIPRDNMNIVKVLDKHKLGWRQKYFEASVAVQDEAYDTSGVESRMSAFRKAPRPIEANPDGLISSSTWTEKRSNSTYI
jgi:hypothetical protein